MKRLNNQRIGIAEGDVVLFSDFEHDGIMWTGEGPRQSRSPVAFSESFDDLPSVRVWLTMWDVSKTTNMRMDVQAEDVTTAGFTIVFRTWADTKVARIRVGWQALGAVRNDDDWDVQ
jgi:hypothetical protein